MVSLKPPACFYFDIVNSFQNKTKECHHLITVVYLDGRYAGIFLFCWSQSVPAGLFLPPSSCFCCSHCCSSLLVPADFCLSLFVPSCPDWPLPVSAGLSLSLLVFFWYLPIPACRFLSPLIPCCLYWCLPLVPTRIVLSLLVCTCPSH